MHDRQTPPDDLELLARDVRMHTVHRPRRGDHAGAGMAAAEGWYRDKLKPEWRRHTWTKQKRS